MNTAGIDRRVRFLAGDDADKQALLDRLDGGTIALLLGDLPSWHEQVLAITLVDLLGRLFPRLSLPSTDAEVDSTLPPGPASLADRLAAARANGGLTPVAPGTPDLRIAIGAEQAQADVFVAATGWQTYLGAAPSRLPGSRDRCPIGPVAAACRAAALAYTRILGELAGRPEQSDGYADVLTYTHGLDPLPEGDRPVPTVLNAALVGVGSVGGAAVHTLRYLPTLDGRLSVIDRESLVFDNPGRALLATAADADAQAAKVDIASEALAHHRITVVTAHMAVTEWHATQPPRAAVPLILTAVDSRESRRAIQDCLPHHLINAACSPDEVHISGHVTGTGPCVCCLHMPQITNREHARKAMIAAATGLPEDMVSVLVTQGVPLEARHLQQIEMGQALPAGSLAAYLGRSLLEVWEERLIYGGTLVRSGAAEGIVANVFVTALAGVLLAAEALKHDNPTDGQKLLGPTSITQYRESPYAGPLHGELVDHARWSTDACLCRSTRRARIASEIYGTTISASGA